MFVVPEYRKRVLTGQVATRVRDLLRQIAAENELQIISGKVAADHVHMFISYRAHQNINQIVQWLKGTSSRVLLQEFPHLKKQCKRRSNNPSVKQPSWSVAPE